MFEIGTASDYIDLLAKLHTFLTAKGSAFGLAFTGVGTGTLTSYSGGASSVAEVFTITATSATQFSVVGSVSGNIGTATVGTPFSHAKLALTINAGGTAFVVGDVFTLSTAPPWTGRLTPTSASVVPWRINVLDTIGGSGSWPVRIGRMELMITPGGADQATGGTASASSSNGSNLPALAFDTDGATFWEATSQNGWLRYDFAAAKAIVEIAITFPTGQALNNYAPKDFNLEYWNGTKWVIAASFRNETAWASGERRVYRLAPYIWKAPGNDGLSEILVGVHPFQNAGAGWYNWRLNGFTAYDADASWFSQPGAIRATEPYGPVLPLSNSSLAYWFVANGRRVVVIVKSGAVYGAAYLGLLQPYASPGQWPYPLFVGGSLWFETEPVSTSANWLVGTAHSKHTCFPLSFLPQLVSADFRICASGRLRKPDGSWLALSARSDFYSAHEDVPGTLWPYTYGFTNLKPDLDGAYSLFPVILFERDPDNVFGQFDGVHAVTGSGLSPEAEITVGRDKYVAFPDVTRSGAGDFFAVRMD